MKRADDIARANLQRGWTKKGANSHETRCLVAEQFNVVLENIIRVR